MKNNEELPSCNNDVPPILSLFTLLYKEITNAFEYNKAVGISKTQFVILLALSMQSPLTMKQISNFVGVSKEQATRMVATIVDKGFAVRSTPETNRKHINIELTESGRTHIERVRHNLQSIIRQNMDDSLSDDEKAKLYESTKTAISLVNKMILPSI